VNYYRLLKKELNDVAGNGRMLISAVGPRD
jgi:hypothetical protein